MASQRRLPLGVAVLHEEQEEPLDNSTSVPLSANVYRDNSDFRDFANRMNASGKLYFLVNKQGVSTRLSRETELNYEEITSNADVRSEEKMWLDCCLRDYLQRKQQFTKRCGSRQKVTIRILAFLLPFLLLLWYFWPLWNFLIDVDAEMFYKTLNIEPTSDLREVKRAYREGMKRWHPDQNPGCGEECRAQTRRIQQAYDVLMARGDHRTELANRYRNELLQVRSLIFFRVYEMAANAAQEFFNIGTKLCSSPKVREETTNLFRLMSSVATILFFTLYETLYVGGFSVMMVLQVFFLTVSMVASAKREGMVAKARKAAYVDLLMEAAVMIIPLAVANVGIVLAQKDVGTRWEELFRVAFGCFYVAAYLYRFMPNLYDNMRKRSCTISMNYFGNVAEPIVSVYGVVTAELGFLVDDLFVFTCRAPSAFRLVVFISHFVYLCQFALLPWEGPLRPSKAPRNSVESERTHASRGEREGVLPTKDLSGAKLTSLSAKDFKNVTNLDSEPADWRLVAAAPYRKLQLEAMVKVAQRKERLPLASEVVACADFESVGIVLVVPDDTPGTSPGTAAKRPQNVKHEVVHLVKDPVACRLLAMSTGPLGMIPAPNASKDVNVLRNEYTRVFGKNATKTPSEIWRSRRKVPHGVEATRTLGSTSTWSLLVLLSVFLSALVLLMLGNATVSGVTVFRCTARVVPKTLQSFTHLRFTRAFPPEHPVNSIAAGLVTFLKGRLTLCTIDVWDAARQFRLYGGAHQQQ